MGNEIWKVFERQVARFFGCERTGPMQIKDASDINHDSLHVQCKYSKRFSILTIWDAAKKVAKQNKKIPVVAIKQAGRSGFWLLVHSDDLQSVANQRCLAKVD